MKKFFTLIAAALTSMSAMAESTVVYSFESGDHPGSNNGYANNCDIDIYDIVWNVTGNATMNPWRVGGKSLDAVDREVYTKTAFATALDKVVLKLGTCSLTSLNSVKLLYSASEDFSGASELTGTVPAQFPGDVTFEAAMPANSYYKFVFNCSVEGTSNKFVQFVGVEFWGEAAAESVSKPEFSVAAGSYYDAQTVALTCATEGAEIHYTLDGTEPSAVSTKYTEALVIAETTTVKAIAVKGNDASVVVTKEYEIAKSYASLADLVAEGEPKGQKVVVALNNEEINDIYVTSSGKRNGIYIMVGDRKVEIYCYDVPESWAVGGFVNGTVKGEWKIYSGTWEVCPSSWEGITYSESTALDRVSATGIINGKRMENGKLYIYSNGVRYNILGQVE